MNVRPLILAAIAASILSLGGCAVTRGQQTVGAYVDDTSITSSIKTRYMDTKEVDATSIRVETLNGNVMLSGFAKNTLERDTAESVANKVLGVRSVRNEIAVRP